MKNEKMLIMDKDSMNVEEFMKVYRCIQAADAVHNEPLEDKLLITARIAKLSCESSTPVSDIRYIVEQAKKCAELALKREMLRIEKTHAALKNLENQKEVVI